MSLKLGKHVSRPSISFLFWQNRFKDTSLMNDCSSSRLLQTLFWYTCISKPESSILSPRKNKHLYVSGSLTTSKVILPIFLNGLLNLSIL